MIHTSLNCDFNGRRRKKRKSSGVVYCKAPKPKFDPIIESDTNHRSSKQQFPSLPDRVGAVGCAAPKKQAPGYTVAIAYNKGGYQVVPDNEVKYIGK